jgi:pimeloyl-ACP methyl ester carboxylesterase
VPQVSIIAKKPTLGNQERKMETYILVHGAWHTGKELEDVAAPIRAAGHAVHLPTIAGNRPGDSTATGLAEAITSIVDFIVQNDLSDVILLGHSYGGMVITGVADQIGERLKRLIYWNAFVPNDGESLQDMVPPHYVDLFAQIEEARGDGTLVLPYPIWREAFINDADDATALRTYELLNPQPANTTKDKISLSKSPAEMEIAKSFINCTEDTALPHSHGWHPRLSEKLGLFRLVQIPGSHEICFSDPEALAQAIMVAGRD